MADYQRSLSLLLAREGEHSIDKSDRGKETYRGIARRFHPSWPGWQLIDAARVLRTFPRCLAEIPALTTLVERFYREEFWNRFMGDSIPDQVLADELLEESVHLGLDRAVEWLQRVVNALNRKARLYANIRVDGDFGTETLKALKACVRTGQLRRLLIALNSLQGAYYLEKMEKDEDDERWAGWIDRAEMVGT